MQQLSIDATKLYIYDVVIMSLGDFLRPYKHYKYIYIYENLCSNLFTNVIYEVARRKKHEVNLYYGYMVKETVCPDRTLSQPVSTLLTRNSSLNTFWFIDPVTDIIGRFLSLSLRIKITLTVYLTIFLKFGFQI